MLPCIYLCTRPKSSRMIVSFLLWLSCQPYCVWGLGVKALKPLLGEGLHGRGLVALSIQDAGCRDQPPSAGLLDPSRPAWRECFHWEKVSWANRPIRNCPTNSPGFTCTIVRGNQLPPRNMQGVNRSNILQCFRTQFSLHLFCLWDSFPLGTPDYF